MVSLHTKFVMVTLTDSKDMMGNTNLELGRVTRAMPLLGWFVICRLELTMTNPMKQYTKRDVSVFTHY